MTYKAIHIANWFINQFDKESGDVITHLKLQKLLYFSEAWAQVMLEDDLFEESIEAWAHGPVVREVFNEFNGAGWTPLNATDDVVELDAEVTDLLSQVIATYGNASAKALEDLTHSESPWIEVRGDLPAEARCSEVITKASIKDYYYQQYGDQMNE